MRWEIMSNNKRSKQELIDECLRKGLPVTSEDNTETLHLYLNMANKIDKDDDEIESSFFDALERERNEKKSRSFLSKLFFFFT